MPEEKKGITADLTKVAENVYNDTLHRPLNSGSNVVTTLMDFFHNTILYPMQKYNLYASNKLENYANELQSKAQAIPADFLVSPKVNILGPVVEGLKYNLDEEYIKEMFTNLLISDMDNRKQSKVLPSYIEIVKQLSQEDAKFLKELKNNNLIDRIPIIQLRVENINNTRGYGLLGNYIICSQALCKYEISPIILDNLKRLQLVEIPFGTHLVLEPDLYESTFQEIKENSEYSDFNNIPDKNLNYSKEQLVITSFGKNFIDICLS